MELPHFKRPTKDRFPRLFCNPAVKIAEMDWNAKYPLLSGYRKICCNYLMQIMDPNRPGRTLRLSRLLGTDPNGTGEIGETLNLGDKICHFRNTAMGTSRQDTEGWTYGYLYTHNKWLRDLFGSREKYVRSVRFLYLEADAKYIMGRQCKAIDDHCSIYGEPPLLNGQVPGVTRKPNSYKSGFFTRSFPRWRPDKSSILSEMIPLGGRPPNPLTGVSCVYFIHMMDPNDPSVPYQAHRAGGIDPLGIMEMGKSTNLMRRLWNIKCAIRRSGHHGEWALFHHVHDISKAMREVFGTKEEVIDHLAVSYIPMHPADLYKGEIWYMNGYIGQYAELPPYNCQIAGDTRRKGG